MDIKRIALAQTIVFLYITSESLTNFFVRILLWSVVFLVIFKEKAEAKIAKVQEKLTKLQEKTLQRFNKFLSNLSISKIIKTLLLLKVAIFFTWLLPGWLFFILMVEAWAFKQQLRPIKKQIKELMKQTSKTIEVKAEAAMKQIPRFHRTTL